VMTYLGNSGTHFVYVQLAGCFQDINQNETQHIITRLTMLAGKLSGCRTFSMSDVFYPDEWVLIHHEGEDEHWRLFASWRGGYLDGESWRLNSGIVRLEEDEHFFYFYSASGTCYEVTKTSYGIGSTYNMNVLLDMIQDNAYTVVQEMPDVMNIDWRINNE